MIGNKILELRKKQNLSQEDLAAIVGVTWQTISNWELNETIPDLKQAGKLVATFNVSMDRLTGNESVLLKKVNNTENNSNLIIKLIKIMGITFGIFLFLLIVLVCASLYFTRYMKDYYTATPSGEGVGRTCYFNGKVTNYLVMKNNSTGKLSLDFEDEDVKSHFDLNNYKNANPEIVLEDIIKYIENNSGVCEKES